MLIPLCGAGDGQLREWALVELQGKIEPQGDADVTQGLVVGAMQLAQSSGQELVQLQIGYHVLEGKRLPLKKPLAILEQQKAACSSEGGSSSGSSSSGSVVCKVVGVLRHKYLFKTRPRALISKPPGR